MQIKVEDRHLPTSISVDFDTHPGNFQINTITSQTDSISDKRKNKHTPFMGWAFATR